MPVTLLFCHGWAFDSTFWDPLASRLEGFPQVRDDAGYSGRRAEPRVEGPCIAVCHSFGTMRLLADPPAGLRGLIAINGFDRFTDAPAFPGVARRLVDRMVSVLAQEPDTIVADFRSRCGAPDAFALADAERLRADLIDLRDRDLRQSAATLGVPILSLQGDRDPILGLPLRETVFAAAPEVHRRAHPSGGHLLPLEHPGWCAKAIAGFVEPLA